MCFENKIKRRVNYLIVIFDGIAVELIEGHICVVLVGVLLMDRQDRYH